MRITEDLNKLITILPKTIQPILQNHKKKNTLIEIIMDLGRRPEARFPNHQEYLSPSQVSWQDLDYSIKKLSQFTDDDRAGIEKTLHRISCIRNREGLIIGLTCRVGRALYGTINGIRDLLESRKSILILGQPGVGKTTMIREIARVLANEMERRVVIIDTSNEIAGDSNIPHLGIGRARRMQVQKTDLQHDVMIQAVENHMPEVIIIDEIGTELETLAAQTIAERGVQLIGTAHGNFLGSLIKNPTLADLVGGIQYVTLSDEEAKRRGTQKSIIERKKIPAFDLAIELNERYLWTIHENVEKSIDILLQGFEPKLQVRRINPKQNIEIFLTNSIFQKITKTNLNTFHNNWKKQKWKNKKNIKWALRNNKNNQKSTKLDKKLKIFVYSISKRILERYLKEEIIKFEFSQKLHLADIILVTNLHFRKNSNLKKYAKKTKIPVLTIKNNTFKKAKNNNSLIRQ